jgi:hypothetical protein
MKTRKYKRFGAHRPQRIIRFKKRSAFGAATLLARLTGGRFRGMAESIWSDGVAKPKPGSGPYRLPLVGRAQVKERAGRNTLLLIVRR